MRLEVSLRYLTFFLKLDISIDRLSITTRITPFQRRSGYITNRVMFRHSDARQMNFSITHGDGGIDQLAQPFDGGGTSSRVRSTLRTSALPEFRGMAFYWLARRQQPSWRFNKSIEYSPIFCRIAASAKAIVRQSGILRMRKAT